MNNLVLIITIGLCLLIVLILVIIFTVKIIKHKKSGRSYNEELASYYIDQYNKSMKHKKSFIYDQYKPDIILFKKLNFSDIKPIESKG
jgi:hypothetical protein